MNIDVVKTERMEYLEDETINEHVKRKLDNNGTPNKVQGLLVIEPEHMMAQVRRRPNMLSHTTLAQVKATAELEAPDDDISGIAAF